MLSKEKQGVGRVTDPNQGIVVRFQGRLQHSNGLRSNETYWVWSGRGERWRRSFFASDSVSPSIS